MAKTVLSIQGEKFLLNGKLTYSEYPGSSPNTQGLLMNARFIQGIFHDAEDETRFHRFGHMFDTERNTDDLIAALPQWYAMGLRALTVGLQGGGPCFTTPNHTICNTAYSYDGLTLDAAYANRLTRILRACDELGMVVIVSLLYAGQAHRLDGARGVLNAVRTASHFLRDSGCRNIILEVANEYDIFSKDEFPLVHHAQGVVALIELAKEHSGLPVGCSGGGGTIHREVAQASDVVLIHGNGQSRQSMVQCIKKARQYAPAKPVVCNEDSQALSNMQVCLDYGVSWGYYNNMTKQEPPTDWGITTGEDRYFAQRMALAVGIIPPPIPPEEEFCLQGLGAHETTDLCFPRLASLYPEQIDHVDFYRDGVWLDRCYDDPFSMNFLGNWMQAGCPDKKGSWLAVATLRNGQTVERAVEVS